MLQSVDHLEEPCAPESALGRLRDTASVVDGKDGVSADAVEHTAKLRGLGLAIVLLKDAEEPRDPVEQPEHRVKHSVDQNEDGHVPVVADPHDGSGVVQHEAPWTDALRTNGDGDPAIVDSANGNAV